MRHVLVHYGTQSLEDMEEAGWEIAAPELPDQNIRNNDRTIILKALADVLNDAGDWEMFHTMAYGSETVRSYALRARSSKSNVSRKAQCILERLQSNIAKVLPVEKRALSDIGQVVRLMGIVISEEEFLRAVPPPISANLNGEMEPTDYPRCTQRKIELGEILQCDCSPHHLR